MKDPAFLFYDGDAARDVSHMNRLERGCYFDLIQAQRKFGRLSIEIIKKILGKDFETCWESVKICLSYDNDMYFIEWLENSTIKRKMYSESRRKNRMSDNQQDTNIICESYVNHMENENENVINNKEKGGVGEKEYLVFSYDKIQEELISSPQWIENTMRSSGLNEKMLIEKIKEFIDRERAAVPIQSRPFSEVRRHFVMWVNSKKAPGKNGKEYTYNEVCDMLSKGQVKSISKGFIKLDKNKYVLK